MKKNETEEVPEDQLDAFKSDSESNKAIRVALTAHYNQYVGRVNIIQQNTSTSVETTLKELLNKFSPKVILVNHEKRLPVDTTCANLSIKYNMIYISAYQLIKEHIEANTEWGKKLLATKKKKDINASLKVRDEFNEAEYSMVHYDKQLFMQLLNETIASKRTN